MIDLAALIADMVRAGVDPDLIGRTAQAFAEREPAPVRTARQERNRRYYEKRSELVPSNWKDIRLQVIERDGTICAYCGEEAEPLHIDHIMPVSRGGSSDLSNLCVSCGDCNVRKKDRTPEEWRATWA